MNRNRRQKLTIYLTLGISGAVSVALLGIAIPKSVELGKFREEWQRMEPLAQKGANLQNSSVEKPPPPDPKLREKLPDQDGSFVFLKSVLQCGVDSGLGEMDNYESAPVASWPPPKTENAEGFASGSSPPPAEGEPPTPTRRHQVRLSFHCDYPSLLKFCDAIQKIPRFTQISSLDLKGAKSALKVEMVVETYSLKGSP